MTRTHVILADGLAEARSMSLDRRDMPVDDGRTITRPCPAEQAGGVPGGGGGCDPGGGSGGAPAASDGLLPSPALDRLLAEKGLGPALHRVDRKRAEGDLKAMGFTSVEWSERKPPALKAGDLQYVRSRIAAMAAFLDEDRRAGVVIDSELVHLLHRHLSGGQ